MNAYFFGLLSGLAFSAGCFFGQPFGFTFLNFSKTSKSYTASCDKGFMPSLVIRFRKVFTGIPNFSAISEGVNPFILFSALTIPYLYIVVYIKLQYAVQDLSINRTFFAKFRKYFLKPLDVLYIYKYNVSINHNGRFYRCMENSKGRRL